MKIASTPLLALTVCMLLVTAGCYYPPGYSSSNSPDRQPAYVSTALVIVVEGEITEPEYMARRDEIINYLIERGYISSEADLVSDPASAARLIRAIVNQSGFTLSVFNQNAAVGPMPNLETTDLLYPADPYFIFGFVYMFDIGPNHLGPRPPDYRPHPRPPHEGPPPGYRLYDHDRHWGRPGQPSRDRVSHPPTPEQRPSGGKQTGPSPTPGKKPDDHANPPPNGNRPPNHDQPSPEKAAPPSGKSTDSKDSSHPADRPRLPRDSVAPRDSDHPQSGHGGPVPSRSPDQRPTPQADRSSSNPAPAPRSAPAPAPRPAPAPAPEKASSTEKSAPASDNSPRKPQEN